MIVIKAPHIHKEASGSVTIIEEVSQSLSKGSGSDFALGLSDSDVSDQDVSPPDFLDRTFRPRHFLPKAFRPQPFWTWTFRPLIFWTRTFRPRTFWAWTFRTQDVSPPDFLDLDVSRPDVSDQDVSLPIILDQDVSPFDNCFIIQNICFSWNSVISENLRQILVDVASPSMWHYDVTSGTMRHYLKWHYHPCDIRTLHHKSCNMMKYSRRKT